MNKFLLTLSFLFVTLAAMAQGSVRGTVYDKQNDEPLGFVTVSISPAGQTTVVGGGMTDIDGKFSIHDLKYGKYSLTISFVGYKEVKRQFEVTEQKPAEHFAKIYMSEDAHQLKEVTVTGQKSAMKLEVDRKSFDVSQLISSAGQAASDILENIPSIEVDNEGNVSLRGNSGVEVWINGKASGLTTDNRAQILQQLPAESIERIEVIDNPSAKFSAEGSAGIINIVLKKDRKAGYYGSVQAGADTRGGYNGSVNVNYNSRIVDAYANIGLRHHKDVGHTESEQVNYGPGHMAQSWQNYNSDSDNHGSPLFSRAGLTFHLTQKDDLSFGGMMMHGNHKNNSVTPYHFGHFNAEMQVEDSILTRSTSGDGKMNMLHGEVGYTHEFGPMHKLDMNFSADKWAMNNESVYEDFTEPTDPAELWRRYSWQSRPQDINNHSYEVKVDYENQINQIFKLEAGYNGRFSHENTPQYSYIYNAYTNDHNLYNAKDHFDPNNTDQYEDKNYFNRFIYDMNVHALYATLNGKFGKFGLMAGLRGEYWTVHTESLDWDQEHNVTPKTPAYEKNHFQLFPSLFASYQLTENDQLQLNYTRRLRRPWGGQLNSFRDTRDATMISFGNPELTPEYSNSFSFNYLKTWTEHSLLVSAYYRPTTDVMQRINWRGMTEDGRDIMYSTSMNLAKSQSEGVEVTLKNKLFRILDLTTNVNAYYYKLDGFTYAIDGQTVRGEENHNFTWNARMQASVILPYDINVQLSGRYRSKQVITQGYRPASYVMDFGVRKNFFNKLFTLSINCRDLLDSRKWESTTESDTFWRHQINRRHSRSFSATLTWNFGNTMPKKRPDGREGGEGGGDMQEYNSAGMDE